MTVISLINFAASPPKLSFYVRVQVHSQAQDIRRKGEFETLDRVGAIPLGHSPVSIGPGEGILRVKCNGARRDFVLSKKVTLWISETKVAFPFVAEIPWMAPNNFIADTTGKLAAQTRRRVTPDAKRVVTVPCKKMNPESCAAIFQAEVGGALSKGSDEVVLIARESTFMQRFFKVLIEAKTVSERHVPELFKFLLDGDATGRSKCTRYEQETRNTQLSEGEQENTQQDYSRCREAAPQKFVPPAGQ